MAHRACAWVLLLLASATLCCGISPGARGGARRRQATGTKPAGALVKPAIVNGKAAPIGRYRYMASLRLNDDPNSFFCGGTLIHPLVVLTAAHCLTDPYTAKNYSEIGYPGMQPPLVRVGGYWAFEEPPNNKAELFRVVRQVVNPKFHIPFTPPLTYNFLNNDVALLLLDRPSTKPVVKLLGPPTPTNSKPNNPVPNWSKVTVMGWGLDATYWFPERLQEVDQQLLPLSTCQKAWGEPNPPWQDIQGNNQAVVNTFNSNSMICAAGNWPVGDKGFCPGDSGGPLIVKGATWAQDVQIGTVSFVSGTCTGANVYANIASVWPWINSTVFALTGNYLNEPFNPKTGNVYSPGPQINGFNGKQYPTVQKSSVQTRAAQLLKIMATPQYTLTASMAVQQSGLAKGPFVGAQRGRAPPNVRGGAPPQNSTVATDVLFKRGGTTVQAALEGTPPRMAVKVNGRSLQQGSSVAISGGRVTFARQQRGASMRVTIEQADLQVQTSQPFSPASFLPWLDVAVTLKACPQPPVTGVLGATLPLCTYRGT